MRHPGATLARRRLRLALRARRNQLGMTIAEVAKAMDWSTSKAIRIESGTVSISPGDLTTLLAHYQVIDTDEIEYLRDLGRRSRHAHWAADHRHHVPNSTMELLGYEDESWRITQYSPAYIPCLLWTGAYARLQLDAGTNTDPATINAWMTLHHRRQVHAATLSQWHLSRIVIDERSLRPTRDRAVLRQQIEAILDHWGTYDIALLEADTPLDPVHPGGFTLLEFHDPLDDAVVCTDDRLVYGELIDEPERTEPYHALAAGIHSQARRGDDAYAALDAIRKQLAFTA